MKILRLIQKWLLGACLTLLAVIPPVLQGAAGEVDPSFASPLRNTKDWSWTAVPAGGQYYLLGLSKYYPGWQDIPADYLTRWNANGTRDNTFQASRLRGYLPGWEYHGQWAGGIQNFVYGMAVNDDGSLLLVGYFGSFSDSSMNRNGSYSFVTDSSGSGYPSSQSDRGSASNVISQADGKFLIQGGFPTATTSLRRLNFDFSVDRTFYSGLNLQALGVTGDGKILFPGTSTPSPGGVTSPLLRPPDQDGSLDTAFDGPLDFSPISALLQPDGAILLLGEQPYATPSTPIVRLLADGSPDPSFTPATSITSVTSMALQADGKILISSSINPLVYRLNTNGSVDSSFTPLRSPTNLSQQVSGIRLLGDGRVLAGGIFSPDSGAGAQAYAMLQNDPAISALEKADATTLRWRRGGSAPEVQRVNFDHRAAGTADWTPLGAGVRIAGGWELRSFDGLPVGGKIRARGWNPGHQNASGWVEATLAVGVPLEEWRLHHFGSTQSTGDGADLADPDRDGFANLIEYLFGSNPEAPSSSPVPAWTTSGSFLECRFSATPSLSPLTVSAQWTPDLTTPWETVQGQTEDSLHIVKVPLNGNRQIFVRLKVSAP